jgi:hypothetical protein
MAHQRAAASGDELRLVVPSACVLQVLALTGLDRWLAIYLGLQAALAAQPPPKL